jgi:hypothetical protein
MLYDWPRTAGVDRRIAAAARRARWIYLVGLAVVPWSTGEPVPIPVAEASSKPVLRLAQRASVRISIAPRIVADPVSQLRLPIEVSATDGLPNHIFVRIRGLPAAVSLSEGYAIAPGLWAISLMDLPRLKAIVPAGIAGQSELIVTIVNEDGAVLGEARSALVIGTTAQAVAPAKPEDLPPTGRTGPNSEATPRPPELSSQERERGLTYLKRGDEQLAQGNFGTARLFYERAANAGLAQGAMALAGTYDAAELERLNVRGVQPDANEARRWYERANQLGASDTKQRLERMSAH